MPVALGRAQRGARLLRLPCSRFRSASRADRSASLSFLLFLRGPVSASDFAEGLRLRGVRERGLGLGQVLQQRQRVVGIARGFAPLP